MTDTVKSASLTNLDASPIVANTAGVGSAGIVRSVEDYGATTVAGLSLTASTYKLLRLPTNVKLKALSLTPDAALDTSTGLALDVGAYYSDSLTDGTPYALAGTVIAAACFASATTAFHSSATAKTDVLTALAVAKRNQPLWKAVGLSSDPGGFIDIVVAVHTAATTGGATNIQLRAEFIDG